LHVMDLGTILSAEEIRVDDGEFLSRYREGDLASAAALYDRHCRGLYLYARSLTGDASRSEDIAHEAFVRLLDRDPRRPPESVQAFLYAVVRNLVRDDLRKAAVRRKKDPILFERRPGAWPGPPSDEAVASALLELPEEQREIVVLKVFAGMTFAKIAEIGGIPPATAASRYRYALEKLAELLGKERENS
jgi:RNA polymerase sigma-70 factor, ECF subfamily